MLVKESTRQLIASVDAAAEGTDAWESVTGVVWAIACFEAEDRGMVDILTASTSGRTRWRRGLRCWWNAWTGSSRAQSSDQMRRDVSAMDVLVAVCGVGKMMATDPRQDDARWRRLVSV